MNAGGLSHQSAGTEARLAGLWVDENLRLVYASFAIAGYRPNSFEIPAKDSA